MKVSLIRKGSKGIQGTIQNAEHHAKPALPLIKAMVDEIQLNLSDSVKEWHQGHNIHILESHSGTKVAVRPFHNKEGDWGLEVLLKVSRKEEYPLVQVLSIRDVATASDTIHRLFTLAKNSYGCISQVD